MLECEFSLFLFCVGDRKKGPNVAITTHRLCAFVGVSVHNCHKKVSDTCAPGKIQDLLGPRELSCPLEKGSGMVLVPVPPHPPKALLSLWTNAGESRSSSFTCRALREEWIKAKYERQEFLDPSRQEYRRGFKDGNLMKLGKDTTTRFRPRRFVLSETEGTLKYYVKEGVSVLNVSESCRPISFLRAKRVQTRCLFTP